MQTSSDMLVSLLLRRIKKLGEECFYLLAKYRKLPKIPFKQIKPRNKMAYYKLAGFLIDNKLHPALYLRVMVEFNKFLYPTNLYGQKAYDKYMAYIQKIKNRYRSLDAFTNVEDASINILRNDLYLVSACDPTLSAEQFYEDLQGVDFKAGVGVSRMRGWLKLKGKLLDFKTIIDPKSYKILRAIVKCESVEGSGFAAYVKVAISAK